MDMAIFDPYKGNDFICKVEALLGVVGILVKEDGYCQFIAYDEHDNLLIYSPMLKAPALDAFCRANIKEYERLSFEYRESIQSGIVFKIRSFWE